MRDFDGPEEFLESLREADIVGRPSSLYYARVQALKFLADKRHARRPPGGPRASAPSAGQPGDAQPLMQRQRRSRPARRNSLGGMPATDDEIREKYLERAIRELNHFTRDLQACPPARAATSCPCSAPAIRRPTCSCSSTRRRTRRSRRASPSTAAPGTALMKSLKRLGIDPLPVYGTLCVKCPVADTALAAPECLARLVEEIAIVQPQDRRGHGRGRARRPQRARAAARARGRATRRRGPDADPVDRRALRARTSTARSTRRRAKRAFWTAFRRARRLVRGLPAVLSSALLPAGRSRRRPRRTRPRPCGSCTGRGPPASSTCWSSAGVSLAPHSSQRSPTDSSVCSSRSMARRGYTSRTTLPSLPGLEALVGVGGLVEREGRGHGDAEVAGGEAGQHLLLDQPRGGGLVLERAGAQRGAVDAGRACPSARAGRSRPWRRRRRR